MRGIRRWLAAVSGRDALERRQAYILQAILLVMIASFLIATGGNVIRELSGGAPANPAPNLIVVGLFAALLVGLRRGVFRIVAFLFVALLVFASGQALGGSGLTRGATYLALLMVPIVIAGLLLPRVLLLVTAVGVYAVAALALQGDPSLTDPATPSPLGNFLFATVFVSVAVDQFGGTVRRALLQAIAHEQELQAGRQALADRTIELQSAVASLETEIAERRRLEEERESMQARMVESQRLESIGLLAGGVAHDFNNLLTAITGYAELASGRLAFDADAQEDLAGVRLAADQAAALTRQLLAFSRRQPLRPTVVDVGDVIVKVEPLLRRLLGERTRFETRPADDLWPVVVDPSQLESVVVNLAVNARDAMESGGTLTIEAANVDLDNDYVRSHQEVVPGSYVMLAVTDTGSGMDEETIARIFEPFFTTKSMGHGTGLGLASVYGTVRQSGGHIWVYSEPGRGTTFKLYFPRAASDSATGPAEEEAAAPTADVGGQETILVAEDEEYVRDMIVAALERRGYKVVAVATGEAALAEIERRGTEFSVLLTDVVMPGIDGLEVLERARAARPNLGAIFMSGYTAQAMDLGRIPDDVTFLEKPFTVARLDRAIREVLRD